MMSLADPEQSAEGSLDPLGLYGIADELASQLCPGVRERQRRARYLTMQAVSLALRANFDEDRMDRFGRTEPWLVFEWHVVQGLVRCGKMDGESMSLPGSQKAANAEKRGEPLSASNYLKTPTVFGFHGVYRLLARDLCIEDNAVLGSAGRELLRVWEEEQGLMGFISSADGPGRGLRSMWREAVEEGLKQGKTVRGAGWSGWQKIADHLHPLKMGPFEAEWLKKRLLVEPTGHRGEMMRFYGSRDGARASSERMAHEALLKSTTSPSLKVLLKAIGAYEHFARLGQNAFDACLVEMTNAHGAVDMKSLADLPAVKTASLAIPERFARTSELLERQSVEMGLRFRQSFDTLGITSSTVDWVARLLDHHVKTQGNKLPLGKRPWILGDGATWRVRPLYAREEMPVKMPVGEWLYVHAYRMSPLSGFLEDFNRARKQA